MVDEEDDDENTISDVSNDYDFIHEDTARYSDANIHVPNTTIMTTNTTSVHTKHDISNKIMNEPIINLT